MSNARDRSLIIRADADTQIGSGHLIRCLALAEQWIDEGGTAVVVGNITPEALRDRVRRSGCELEPREGRPGDDDDAATLCRRIAAGTPAVVLDGYAFGPQYQQTIFSTGRRLLVIDDMAHHRQYFASVVLNQNAGAEQHEYRVPSGTTVLRGPAFALLRRQFRHMPRLPRAVPAVAEHVLITMGASDRGDRLETALAVLAQAGLDELQVTALCAGSQDQYDRTIAAARGLRLALAVHRDVADVASFMAAADFALSAAGSTVWELAFFGVPSLLFVVADNQRATAEALDARGVAVNAGVPGEVDSRALGARLGALLKDQPARQRMNERGRELVDGRGAERVLRALLASQA